MAKKIAKSKKPSAPKLWLAGARLRTLPLAIAPVILGGAAAMANTKFQPVLFLLALAVALLLQIGVNYANDYSDGIRGTDANRVGPLRLTASGLVRSRSVKIVAFVFFGLAGLVGLEIVVLTGFWWLLAVGALCILAAWYYTGGKHPYGYAGLGEIAVFVFFGLVATIGTSFIQEGEFDLLAAYFSVAAGLLASAVLMVNNIRDIKTDTESGKRTLAVKLGARKAKGLFYAMLWLPVLMLVLVVLIYPNSLLAFSVIFLIGPTTLIVA
ncbi:MAG: hypothetical protein RL556_499, partial [Actinomycetota bacterium]